MIDSDFEGLPENTINYARRLYSLGIDRTRIHGLFVLLGLCAGAPRELDELQSLFKNLDNIMLLDRSRNIDDLVGELYQGYDFQINEFCYRSGFPLKFKKIEGPNDGSLFSIVTMKDENILNSKVTSINMLSECFNLYDAFIFAIGKPTSLKNNSLKQAFCCGIFQIQLHAVHDDFGAQQISTFLQKYSPLFYAKCISTLSGNNIDYFLGLEKEQVALLGLMSSLEPKFCEEMWAFQSSLFYDEDGKHIGESDILDIDHFHAWAVKKAMDFYVKYGSRMMPFSLSGAKLSEIPPWKFLASDIKHCDTYIKSVWGYDLGATSNKIINLEYRAILIFIIYLSLAKAIES
jgi:hypothetical protein